MSSFTDTLILSPLPDGRNWRLEHPFEYWIDEVGQGPYIRCPKGMITDFASVPRIFWNILPPWGRYGKAAIVHDRLYRTLGRIEYPDGSVHLVSRSRCDWIFFEAMRVLGVAAWKRWALYLGVRLGGWWTWRRYSRR